MIIKSIKEFKGYSFEAFDSGNEELNLYFKKYALINDDNNIGKTFVLSDNEDIIGFVTICNAQVEFQEMPATYTKWMPKYPVPAIRIARLAVDTKYQRKGYGTALLSFAFKKILLVSYNSGIKLVIVDAKDSSKAFYEGFGFKLLKELTYYLPIETLISAAIS